MKIDLDEEGTLKKLLRGVCKHTQKLCRQPKIQIMQVFPVFVVTLSALHGPEAGEGKQCPRKSQNSSASVQLHKLIHAKLIFTMISYFK